MVFILIIDNPENINYSLPNLYKVSCLKVALFILL